MATFFTRSFKALFAFALMFTLTGQLSAQTVVNDVCPDAISFPTLVSGVTSCLNGSNIGANGELPYINQGFCLGGAPSPAPAADIWFSFTAVSNILDVDISFDTETIVVSLYEGTCAALIGRECEVGTGGALNTTFAPVAPGVVYYLQISGGSVTDQGEFGICIENYADNINDICMLGQTLNVSPPPLLGTYPPGESINFCFTVAGYNQNASDWFHGLVPVFGNGWDLSTLGLSSPASCSTGGTWSWYNLVQGTSAYAATIGPQGPGFFYETASGGPGLDTNPGNNFGDVGATGCSWTFCFSISTLECPPGENNNDLSITFLNFSDSETGSWGAISSICPEDPEYKFKALLACCAAPVMTGVNPTCANPNGGSVTATPTAGNPPYIYEWSNGFTQETSGASSITGLAEGFYTVTVVDDTGCSAVASFTLVQQNTGFDVILPLTVEGCGGCEASPAAPALVNVVDDATGDVFATLSVTACPSFLTICLPETGSFSLSYSGQVIPAAVVNGLVTAPLFAFNTGTPSFAGTMNPDTQVICAGNNATVTNNVDEVLNSGAVFTYGLCTNPSDVAGTLVATSASGSFSGNGLMANATYFAVAIAGPEGSTPGLPDFGSACTHISNATPIVFLAPVSLVINEFCDWLTGDYHVILFVAGGYPAYDNTASYFINGDYFGPLASGETIEVIFPEGSTAAYSFEVVSDGFGCTGALANEAFICYKTPIELLSFTGRVQTNGNLLQWVTATETDNDYFTLERSTDNGQTFTAIATVKGQGNSIVTQHYQWLDTNAPAGMSYYRLSQTDFNGTQTSVPNIVALNRGETGLAITQIHPTPALQTVNIEFTAPDNQAAEIKVFNVAGQLVHAQVIPQTHNINTLQLEVANYAAGMYLVSITTAQQTVVAKLVKE